MAGHRAPPRTLALAHRLPALTPALLAEDVALHVLLQGVPIAAWAMTGLCAYALLWL
ncbi:MAG: hypothetical protein M3P39_07580 [Actinomycetota bacterium]|nr:hypothetical protein [Actinomycetota bacterium]